MKLLKVAATAAAAAILAVPASAQTLEEVRERGHLNCGINTGLVGFAFTDQEGNWQGFDVAFCKAVAAAVFDDPDAVEYTPLMSKVRFTALASGEVHLRSRNTTMTARAS